MIDIKNGISLLPYNTLKMNVKANEFVEISSVEDLRQLSSQKGFPERKKLVLSAGSNVLFSDDFDGLIMHNAIFGISVVSEERDQVILKVNGGESWPDLVEYTIGQGWGGLENLTLIPGKVGAAPIQNIGAYGVEVKDVIVSVEAFDFIIGKQVLFSADQCQFGYRSSIFKTTAAGRYFITAVVFRLSKFPRLNLTYGPLRQAFEGKTSVSIQEVSAEVAHIRRSKLPDPEVIPNAGSFFKNPIVDRTLVDKIKVNFPDLPLYQQNEAQVKLAAGWLIEQCGWKGYRMGEVGVHEKQALVLVNYGQATGAEILDLATEIQDSVLDRFGVILEPEVNIY
ncbi:MAG: UDP-N-acetylenolpyruvoylglucosamine reductase [Bacteroidetes bacterium HGW-Bacteroidetes-16]|jgi:UDP-N-acetylmuramate dehydrogenase|nr:MAG: UDP-N-acetylenolpyruvoylglucosamine reductase [Bacteroidetes bacterium HGW-Bacteroidetes-16]